MGHMSWGFVPTHAKLRGAMTDQQMDRLTDGHWLGGKNAFLDFCIL